MPGVKDRLVGAAYRLGWSAVCRLPESWARRGFDAGFNIAWRRQGPSVQVLEANLVRVLGQDVDGKTLRATSRAAMRSYGRYWLETFRLSVMPIDRLVDGMRDSGDVQTALEHLAAGRGVIFALPHMGNWDQAGAWIIAKGAGSFTTVMERLEPESVYELFIAFREGLGFEVLPASGGVRPFGILAQRLRAGKLVCLVCDRDVTGAGLEVEFFGEKAKMMAGAGALAVATGAALMPAALWFDGDGWGLHVGEEIPVPAASTRKEQVAAMMQQVACFFEDYIRQHPQDWHMLQRVFVDDLDPERQAAAAARAAQNGQAELL